MVESSPKKTPSPRSARASNSPTSASVSPNLGDQDAEQLDDFESEDELLSTVSLSDTIRDYRKIHGRTFSNSKTTDYWAPNDDQQNDGLDITHHFLLLFFDNKLFQAPIKSDIQTVLDVGTGTGLWAIDFADQFPSAKVIGTDISPIQPPWVPPNCEFHIDDAQLDWTWPEDHFDYIHIRDLYGGISDWPALYKRVFQHLKPGGWFEDQEFDIRCHSDVVGDDPKHIYNQWNETFAEAGEKLGKTFKIGKDTFMKDYMEDAGFVNCTHRKVRIPIGPWSSDPKLKEIGAYVYAFVTRSIEGFALFLLIQIMGWTYEECQVMVASMTNAVKKYKQYRPYYEVTLVYGQKPA